MLIHLTTAGISLIAMTALLASGSIPKAQKTVKNIVLVHGAFADGSGWEGVYKILTKKGYKVSIVSNPLTGFADDVAATKRVIDRQDGPLILVGHSYTERSSPKRVMTPRPQAWYISLHLHRTPTRLCCSYPYSAAP